MLVVFAATASRRVRPGSSCATRWASSTALVGVSNRADSLLKCRAWPGPSAGRRLDRGEQPARLDAISARGCLHPFVLAIGCKPLFVGTRLGIRDSLVSLDVGRSLRLGCPLPSADSRVDRQLKSVTVSTHGVVPRRRRGLPGCARTACTTSHASSRGPVRCGQPCPVTHNLYSQATAPSARRGLAAGWASRSHRVSSSRPGGPVGMTSVPWRACVAGGSSAIAEHAEPEAWHRVLSQWRGVERQSLPERPGPGGH